MVGAKLKLLSPVGESARCRKITYSRTYPQFLIQLSTKGWSSLHLQKQDAVEQKVEYCNRDPDNPDV